ncbi:MAG: GUN4 domain-containing protein [Nostoc sp.]|uniref:GUN4 domain-containing protein n=1 Tax=Nostoc sp. TaxID=1180 RepID=UPI002FF7BFD1
MAKNNQTVLVLTLLITASLIGIFAVLGWIGYSLTRSKSENKSPGSTNLVNTTTNPSSLKQVEITTARNVDYSQLQKYLQSKDWQKADRETYLRMLDVAGTKAQAEGAIAKDEMNALSCVDLKTIDRLWSTASDGKLGFSAQEKILREQKNDYRKMYDAVGWQTLTGEWLIQWNYNQQTKRYEYKPGKEPNFKSFPPGHLPTVERGYNFDVSLDAALTRCGI